MTNIYSRFLVEQRKNRLALATIVATKGSSPQVPGASALFSEKGLLTGTLGGGLLEAKAEEKALASLKNGRSSLSRFELYGNTTSEEEAICGGEATILFDASPADHEKEFKAMARSLDSRRSGVLVTQINQEGGSTVHLSRSWVDETGIVGGEAAAEDLTYHSAVKEAFSSGKPLFFPKGHHFLYIEPQFPFSCLVIAGAGHVGQAVAHIGHLLDFEVTVIDDRPEFANKDIVPDADQIIVDNIGKAIAKLAKTEDTYFVIVTRGHSHDADALRGCIASDAAYIGMIGSRRKIALMREKFITEGWATASQFDRVSAPIGIDIQSKTVQEIAVSIAAQLVQVRNLVKNQMKEES